MTSHIVVIDDRARLALLDTLLSEGVPPDPVGSRLGRARADPHGAADLVMLDLWLWGLLTIW
jgi:hypothetical protein